MPDTKICNRCERDLPLAQFNFKNKATGKRQGHCRDCQRDASRAHYENNRTDVIAKAATRNAEVKASHAQFVADALCGRYCEVCGATSDLTFRVNREYAGVRVSVAVHSALAMETLLEAMANSRVVCKKCEGLEQGESLRPFQFGTPTREAALAELAACKEPRPGKSEYKKRYTRTAQDRRGGSHGPEA